MIIEYIVTAALIGAFAGFIILPLLFVYHVTERRHEEIRKALKEE